jgi:hypothetical protein
MENLALDQLLYSSGGWRTAIYRDGFLKIVLPKARSHLIQLQIKET